MQLAFQYISCLSTSVESVSYEKIEDEFQYISCLSTRVGVVSDDTLNTNFNTSHVLVLVLIDSPCVICLIYFNTSHVLVLVDDAQSQLYLKTFQYISCLSTSLVVVSVTLPY